MNTYDLDEAAAIAKIHRDTLRKMAKKRERGIPGAKVGRSWIFPVHLFDSWIEKQCLSTDEKDHRIGGSGSQSLASRLEKRLAQKIANKQKSSNSASSPDATDSTS